MPVPGGNMNSSEIEAFREPLSVDYVVVLEHIAILIMIVCYSSWYPRSSGCVVNENPYATFDLSLIVCVAGCVAFQSTPPGSEGQICDYISAHLPYMFEFQVTCNARLIRNPCMHSLID